jgi:signal transduction histidine kinase
MMRSLGLDTLEVLDARLGHEGEVIGSGHYPGRAGGRDPALLAEARGAEEAPWLAHVRVREAGEARDVEAVLTACEVRRRDVRLVVIGGRTLDNAIADLATDVESVAVVLERDGSSWPDAPVVHEFVSASGAPAARLVALVDDSSFAAQLTELDRGFWGGGAVGVLLATIFGLFLALSVSKPFSELEAAAARVGSGDLESTIGVRSNNEVGRALKAFNRMTHDLKSTREKLLRAERIAAWRDIARRIAHEVKNPLSPIQVAIETMQKTYRKKHPDFDEIFEESTAMILDEVQKLSRLVTEFSDFARMPSPKKQPVDVGELVRHTESLYRGQPSVVLEVELTEPLPIVGGDRDQLSEVMTNLVKNAIEAARAKHVDLGHVDLGHVDLGHVDLGHVDLGHVDLGHVDLGHADLDPTGSPGARVRIVARSVPGGAEVRIHDNGPGIAPENRARVFEPYFTTKAEGTGLGLSIVHRIVTDHRGTIRVDASPLGGAEFIVFLSEEGPRVAATASHTDAAVLPLTRRR